MIVKIKKTKHCPKSIRITTSATSDFTDVRRFTTSYDTVVGKNQYVYLVTNKDDADVLQKINHFDKTLPEINLKMQTGIIVDFRTREVLRNELEEGAYPLLDECRAILLSSSTPSRRFCERAVLAARIHLLRLRCRQLPQPHSATAH